MRRSHAVVLSEDIHYIDADLAREMGVVAVMIVAHIVS